MRSVKKGKAGGVTMKHPLLHSHFATYSTRKLQESRKSLCGNYPHFRRDPSIPRGHCVKAAEAKEALVFQHFHLLRLRESKLG